MSRDLVMVPASELFPTTFIYVSRSTDELCSRCGAKPGFMCFEIERDIMKAYPVHSHVVRMEKL